MKKILSFVLVLAMIASMMCISVSAEDTVTELTSCATCSKTHLVGQHGHDENNSAETPDATSDTMLIKAFVNGKTVTKYAVDLVFTQKTIYIESDLEWDVNKLHYEGTAKIAILDNATSKENVASDKWQNLEDYQAATNETRAVGVVHTVAKFAVTNYSCADITVKANVSTATSGNGLITTVVHETGETWGERPTASGTFDTVISTTAGTVKAVAGYDNIQSGTAYTMSYEADMYCVDWATALYNMADEENDVTFTIASITFTISSTNPNQTPAEGEGAGT